jgi:hypothetical protein
MPVPDFSPGEVLTAAAMDSIGLWLVKSQTVGAGVSQIDVTGAFSADYENYKITYTGGNASTNMNIRFRMGATTTNYYSSLIYNTFASSAPLGVAQNNTQPQWEWGGASNTTSNMVDITLLTPFATERTRMISNWSPDDASGYSSNVLLDTTSYTGFSLLPGVGGATFTGGTVRVYGYRN